MTKNQIVGLKSIKLNSNVASFHSLPTRAIKKRVFTEDELNFLNTRTVDDLRGRISRGQLLIRLLHNPAMLNMSASEAAMISSNLKYQIDTIREIIRSKKNG